MSTDNQEQGQTAQAAGKNAENPKDLSYLTKTPFPTDWAATTEHKFLQPGKNRRTSYIRKEYPSGLVEWRTKSDYEQDCVCWVPAIGWVRGAINIRTDKLIRTLKNENILPQTSYTDIPRMSQRELKDFKGPVLNGEGKITTTDITLNTAPLKAVLMLSERRLDIKDFKRYAYDEYSQHIRVQVIGTENRHILVEGHCRHTAAFYVQDLGFSTEPFCTALDKETLGKILKRAGDKVKLALLYKDHLFWSKETIAEKLNAYKKLDTKNTKNLLPHPDYYGVLGTVQAVLGGTLKVCPVSRKNGDGFAGMSYRLDTGAGAVYGVIMGNGGVYSEDALLPEPKDENIDEQDDAA